MDEKQKKIEQTQKNIILVLILGIIAIGLIGFYAFSKYIASVEGEGEAQIAKWSFKVNGTDITKTETIALSMTLDEGYNNVTGGKVAPGTTGSFILELDGSESEVAIAYSIELGLEGKPKNLILYKDNAYEKPVAVSADGETGTIKGFIMLNEDKNKQKKTETIYWKWLYETPTPAGQAKSNDEIDTEDSKKESMTIGVTVTATQTLEEPQPTLADYVTSGAIKVGDYVNYQAVKKEDVEALESYDPTSGETNNDLSKYAYVAKADRTGTASDQTFKATNKATNGIDDMKWRVLKVNENNVEIIPADGSGATLTLGTSGSNDMARNQSKEAFLNSEEVLNEICEIYGKGYGAERARSIDIGDIEAHYTEIKTEKNPKEVYENTNFSPSIKTGGTYDYETGNYFLKEIKDEATGEVIGYEMEKGDNGEEKFIQSSSTNQITMTQTFYTFTGSAYFETSKNKSESNIYYTLFKESDTTSNKSYWLASRCVNLYSEYCHFAVQSVGSSGIGAVYLFGSYGDTNGAGRGVCPVVTLDSNIPMVNVSEEGATNATWDLK